MGKVIFALWAACICYWVPFVAYAGEWIPISDTSAVIQSEDVKGVYAGVIASGQGVEDFIPYFAVAHSEVCGGKEKDSFSVEPGPGSIYIAGGPKVSAQTTCIGQMSVIAPETSQGIGLFIGYFMNGRFGIYSQVRKSEVRFNTEGVTKYLVDKMNSRQNRGL